MSSAPPSTQVMEPPAQNGPVPLPPHAPRRQRLPWVVVGVLVLALAAVATVFLLNRNTGNTTYTESYQPKLTAIMTPIVNDNIALSKSLQAVDGSKSTLRAATTATQTAQQAVQGARGSLAAITVPARQQQLNQQATQALTQESGFLQAVNSTLADPSNSASGSLQSLASATNAAFVPLADVAPGGSTSVYGVDNLLSWVSGAQAAGKRNEKPKVIVQNNTTTTTVPVTPTLDPNPGTSDAVSSLTPTYCSNGVYVETGVTCGFAENVFAAVYSQWKDNGNVFPSSLSSVYSPAAGSSFDLTLVSSTPSWALYQNSAGQYMSIGEYALSVY